MPTPLPEEVIHALQHSRAQAFCHEVVMDAIDLSMALDRHLLLYGLEGLFLLETDQALWRLPPSRAAWIPAGTMMTATTIKRVRCTSIFFRRDFATPLAGTPLIFGVNPVVREMISHSRQWTAETMFGDEELERFFRTLLDLCREQLQENQDLALPKASSPELANALTYTRAHLDQPIQLKDAARAAAMSPRTVMRKLNAEIHMTWGAYLQQARMIAAMECLARGMQVTETTFEVGYSNMAAFSTAFRRFTGMTPTEYQAKF